MAKAKDPKKTAAPADKAKPRADWEAIERDYRTGRYTLRELQARHGAAFATIGQRAKREGWKQDLQAAVRQATNAKVVEALITQETHKATHSAAETVIAAADINSQVVLRHCGMLTRLADDAEAARAKVVELMADVTDLREASAAAGALESLSRTTKNLIDKERQALRLDEPEEKPRPTPPAPGTIPPGAEVDAYRAWVHG